MERGRSWIVGTDLSARSRGALRFAHWLHARSADEEAMTCVHVGTGDDAETRFANASDYARAAAESLRIAHAFESFETVIADTPEEGLARVAKERDVEGVIIGRAGRIDGWSLISLGRVARRLLRTTPKPVVVTAPDYEPRERGKGPIVVGVVPTDAGATAASFAYRLATRVDIPLLLVHVTTDIARYPAAGIDPAFAYAHEVIRRDETIGSGASALAHWREVNGLAETPIRCEPGLPGQKLLQIADDEDASLIVVGSRQLSLAERILSTSTGSELAANADQPVVVVPPA